jgi:hypothetical protein
LALNYAIKTEDKSLKREAAKQRYYLLKALGMSDRADDLADSIISPLRRVMSKVLPGIDTKIVYGYDNTAYMESVDVVPSLIFNLEPSWRFSIGKNKPIIFMNGKAGVEIPNIINFDIFYRNNYNYIYGFGLGVDNIFGKLKISYQFEKNIYSAFKDGYSNSGSAFLSNITRKNNYTFHKILYLNELRDGILLFQFINYYFGYNKTLTPNSSSFLSLSSNCFIMDELSYFTNGEMHKASIIDFGKALDTFFNVIYLKADSSFIKETFDNTRNIPLTYFSYQTSFSLNRKVGKILKLSFEPKWGINIYPKYYEWVEFSSDTVSGYIIQDPNNLSDYYWAIKELSIDKSEIKNDIFNAFTVGDPFRTPEKIKKRRFDNMFVIYGRIGCSLGVVGYINLTIRYEKRISNMRKDLIFKTTYDGFNLGLTWKKFFFKKRSKL